MKRFVGDHARLWAPMLVAAATACSDDGGIEVSVQMTASSLAALNPYAPEVGLEVVQVTVDGAERGDDATVSLAPSERTATVSGLPLDGDSTTLTVRAEGLDAQGNLVAFGRGTAVDASGSVSLEFPLRRNLAYITHQPNAFQRDPENYLYVIDMATRSLVQKVRLPGIDPQGERVTARGGESLLVTYRDQGTGYLGILSADDHSWTSVELPQAQRVGLGVEGASIGVVAGGGIVTFVDLDAGEVVGRFPAENEPEIGGTVRDGVIAGDGRSALFILGGVTIGSVIFVDLDEQRVEPLDVVRDPAGVALGPDGRVAFVTSGIEPAVAEVDLRNGRVAQANGFVRPVGLAAYSENMQAVLALDAEPAARRVLALLPRANCPEDVTELCGQALPLSDATPTTENPVDIAADGVGRRVLVVGTGTSTDSAGLTLIETFEGVQALPIGARTLYPGDPDDTFTLGRSFVGRQRYQPRSVAIIYGR